jgi:hypothetical protein
LLACVEQLTKTSEASEKDLTALEARSTNWIETELASLKDSAALLIRSPATDTLMGLVGFALLSFHRLALYYVWHSLRFLDH